MWSHTPPGKACHETVSRPWPSLVSRHLVPRPTPRFQCRRHTQFNSLLDTASFHVCVRGVSSESIRPSYI